MPLNSQSQLDLTDLQSHPGWKLLQEELRKKKESLKDSLWRKVLHHQNEEALCYASTIDAIDFLLTTPASLLQLLQLEEIRLGNGKSYK